MDFTILCHVFWTVQHCRYIWMSSVKNAIVFHREIQHFQNFVVFLKSFTVWKSFSLYNVFCSLFCGFLFPYSFFPLFFTVWLLGTFLCCFIAHWFLEVNCISYQVLEDNIYSSHSYGACLIQHKSINRKHVNLMCTQKTVMYNTFCMSTSDYCSAETYKNNSF